MIRNLFLITSILFILTACTKQNTEKQEKINNKVINFKYEDDFDKDMLNKELNTEDEIIEISKEIKEFPNLGIKKVKVNNEKMILLNTNKYIYFDSNKHKIKNLESIKKISSLLLKHKKIKINLIGHTDSKGDDRYNQLLSELRAKEVYKYLLNNDININQIDYIGYGEEQPITSNEKNEGRALNRRVEILISQTSENANIFIQNRKINIKYLNNHSKVNAGSVKKTIKGQTKNKSDAEIKKLKSKVMLPKRKILNFDLEKRKHIIGEI